MARQVERALGPGARIARRGGGVFIPDLRRRLAFEARRCFRHQGKGRGARRLRHMSLKRVDGALPVFGERRGARPQQRRLVRGRIFLGKFCQFRRTFFRRFILVKTIVKLDQRRMSAGGEPGFQ